MTDFLQATLRIDRLLLSCLSYLTELVKPAPSYIKGYRNHVTSVVRP